MTDGRWVKRRIALTSEAWTPVAAPGDMDYVAFRCDTSAVVLRTDVDDPDTEDTLPAGAQEGVTGTRTTRRGATYYQDHRFSSGEVICHAKSVQPTATLITTWVD